MNKPTGLGLVNAAGVAQGLALVTFPAASTIFTSPNGYGFSETRYGLMFLPQVVMAILASSTAPKLARRWSLKRVLLVGLGSDIAAMLLAMSRLVETEQGFAYGLLLIATGALGFGFGAALTALSTLAEVLSPGREDRSVLTLNALLGTGTALAPALVALFLGLGVWWMLPVCVACALVVLLLMTLKEQWVIPQGASKGDNIAARGGKLPRQFWVFAGATFIYGILEPLNGNWASLYLVSQRGVSMQAASWALMAFWAMVTLGRLLFAALSTKVSVRTIYIALPFLLAIAFRIVSRVRTEVGGLFAFGIAGLSCSAFFPLSISLAGDEFPALSAVMSGELIAFYQLGYGVAAFGTGPLRNLGGFSFATIFAGGSVLAIGMGILAILIVRDMTASSRR